jgi:hypothetical protein
LAVLDDLWGYDAASLLLQQALPANTAVLVTTRDTQLAKRLNCQVQRIDVLSEQDALALFTQVLGPLGEYEKPALELAQVVGRLPLALRILAGIADCPADLADILRKLRTKPVLEVLALAKERREESVEASGL